MNKIELDEKYILEYIKDQILSLKVAAVDVKDFKYHHNSKYSKTPSIIYNGILSQNEFAKLNNTVLSEEQKLAFSDEYFVNGDNNISLSIVGLKDLDPKKMVYNPFSSTETDILISKDVRAFRSSANYDNEFLARNKIENSYFKSVDVRLLKYINDENSSIKQAIEYYNNLKLIAQALIDTKLDIPLREMSKENITLDIEKAAKARQLILK